MKAKFVLTFICVFLIRFLLIGQFSTPIHYTVKDGLPSSTTYDIAQDSLGYVWIGTEAGLVRFDGSKFKVFTTQDGLPDNEVLGLIFDSLTSRLWIITYTRAVCYYRHGIFYTAKNDSSLRGVTGDYGEFIGGNIQPGLGVFLYNGSSVFECFHDRIKKTEMDTAPIFQIRKWADGKYDALSNVGISEFRNGRRIFDYKGYEEIPGFNRGIWIDSILYRYVEGGVFIYDKSKNYHRTGEIKLPTARMTTGLLSFGNSYIICVAMDGVFLAGKSDTSVKKIWSGNVNAIRLDKQGNLWIMTNDDGIYIINNSSFSNYIPQNRLVHDNVTAFYWENGGTLYLGNTFGELYALKDGLISSVKDSNKAKQEKVRAITTYGNSIFYITNTKVFHFDKSDRENIEPPHISGGPKTILKLRDSTTILIGLLGSMIEFNMISGATREIYLLKRIIDMAQHADGRIFCGSLDGLYLYKNDSMVRINNGDPRLNSRITSLCMTKNNILWIGTPANGIMAYDGNKIIAEISQAKYMGYHGTICRKIVNGKKDEIWVATNRGVNRIKYHLNDTIVVDNITPLNTTDGLNSDDVNTIIEQDSLIYIATSQGMTILNENRMNQPSFIPIYISSITINNKDSAIHDGEYKLTYLQNSLKIDFVAICLPSAGFLRYQYRLLGSSNDKWETTTNTSIEFRSLSPGTYTFEAVVLDKFGNKSPSIARVKFKITPAFYMTIWFWAICVILILAIGFYIIRDRFQRQRRQFEKEQGLNNKIIELEQQALKAQMNPHFIFNCLTAVQHFVNSEDMYSANMYLSNFARLIRKTLDLSGEQYISLDKEVAYLQNYVQLEKMRFQEKFQYTIKVSPDIDTYSVEVPPMLLQPIIENAIRHGLRNMDTDTGLLKIEFTKEDNKLICTIDDNGVGMKRARELKTTMHVEYQSKGMSLTTSRIDAINMISDQKITIDTRDKYDNNEAAGTLVILSFEQKEYI